MKAEAKQAALTLLTSHDRKTVSNLFRHDGPAADALIELQASLIGRTEWTAQDWCDLVLAPLANCDMLVKQWRAELWLHS